MLRYAVEFNIIHCTDITVCVDARNEKDAVRKASKEKILRKQINELLDVCIAEFGVSVSDRINRKNERRFINGIIHNPMHMIRQHVCQITKMKEV
jgi:hypothetical protein